MASCNGNIYMVLLSRNRIVDQPETPARKEPSMNVMSKLTGAARPATEEEEFCSTLPFDFEYYSNLRTSIEAEENDFVNLDPVLNPILFQNKYWKLTPNRFANTRPCSVMLLIIPKEPWRQIEDISENAWRGFYRMIKWIKNHYDLPGGMLFVRFGDMRLNAGTIMHLHWNLWVPSGAGPLFAPIFKSEAERVIDNARAKAFALRYEAGERA